jgi:AcrR family transcriptional regulator
MSARALTSLAPRKRPSQARSQARVRRILQAARELVESGPLEAVTTTAIARRADLPIGSLYQYFPNRLSILAELASRELRAIDDATIDALEASGDLPWPHAVDLVVDRTADAHRDHARCAVLFRSLHPAPEFRDLARESNARLARALARHPALRGCGRPAEAIERVARVAIEAGDAVQGLALGAESPDEAAALAAEMKKLLKAYLALSVDPPGARPSGEDPRSPHPEDRR